MQPTVSGNALRPAFASPGRLYAFCAAVLLGLTLPVLLTIPGLPPKNEAYLGVTKEAGRFAFMERVIFEEKGEIDILVFSSSLLRASFDATVLETGLSSSLGRPAQVVVTGVNWPGLDMQYVLLKEFLEHRKVKLLVLSLPIGQAETFMPHVQIFRLLRWGENPELFDGLGVRPRASLYGAMVLGAPRQALNLLRPNRVADYSGEVPKPGQPRGDELGYYGAPFQRVIRPRPQVDATEMIASRAPQGSFRYQGAGLNGYQNHWLRKLAELAAGHAARVVFVNVPLASDKGKTWVPERLYWPGVFGPATEVIGIPSARLFAGMTDEDFYRFYFDEHLNRNGREHFTKAILPALLEVYASTN